MSLLIRVILAIGAGLAAAFLSRDEPIFPVAQMMFGVAAACLVLLLLAILPRILPGARHRR